MAIAGSNLTYVRYAKEDSFGVIPASAPRELRFTGESLKFSPQTDTSKEIRSDRQVADLILLSGSADGGVQFELSYGFADDLIEAAACGTWEELPDMSQVEDIYGLDVGSVATGHVVTNGTVHRSFTIEKGFTDVNQYIAHRGMNVSQFSLDFQSASILTGSFEFLGKDAVLKDGSTNFSSAVLPVPTGSVMNTSTNVGRILQNGSGLDDIFLSSVSFNINNQPRGPNAVGHMGAVDVRLGTQLVTGTAEVYFSDGQMYQQFLNNTAFSMAWHAKDAEGNGLGIYMPRVKWTDGTVQSGSLDQDVVISLPFQAIFDPSAGNTFMLHRFTSN